MKTEKTKKLKRVKKDADIPESLEGEPSGSDLQIPVTPYEIVWEHGHANSNYGSFWQQNLPYFNEGEASFSATSYSEISPTANLVVDDYAVDSAQPLCSTEGHNNMPTSYGLAESEETIEELMDCFFDPDEDISWKTIDGIFNEYSPQKSLEMPTSYGLAESEEPIEELMDCFFVPDENISGKTTDGIFNESSHQKSLETPFSYGFDEPEVSITELLESFVVTEDNISKNTLDGLCNLSSQQTSLEMLCFPDYPVSSDAEGVDGQVNVLGPLAPGGLLQ